MMKQIPIHLLKDQTDVGLQLKQFRKGVYQHGNEKVFGAHRDDHYIFFILQKGEGSILIDFNEMPLPEGCLYYVLPSQVHQRIQNENADGWYIAVDTSLVPAECRSVFEGRLFLQQPHPLSTAQLKQFHELLMLLSDKYEEERNGAFGLMALHSLLRSLLAMAAGCYDRNEGPDVKVSRPAQITAQFRDLLAVEMRTIKSPADYAARLNVSETYLSEALKKVTGFPASYWIQQEVMMEAKRLLYYSQLTVKEIAHDLGYADHSYFSRLFRKVTGIPANVFREQYRK
jgi:AraC family transcriptional activator of pobA